MYKLMLEGRKPRDDFIISSFNSAREGLTGVKRRWGGKIGGLG